MAIFHSLTSHFCIHCSFSNEDSNVYTWLRYLNPQQGRLFVPPLQKSKSAFDNTYDWRKFAGNVGIKSRQQKYGDQFGKSFSNFVVGDLDSWEKAVEELRSKSNAPKKPEFINWISNQKSIGWNKVISYLNTTGKGVTFAQVGNPTYALQQLQQRNYKTMALWDIRCRNFNYTTMDSDDPAYWMERWETYRLFYLGGRWFARLNTTTVELYNEPDKDKSCMTPELFADDVRVRSTALRDAYTDYNLWADSNLNAYLVSPATSQAYSEGYTNAILSVFHKPFPYDMYDSNYAVSDAYSFHKYGSFSKGNCSQFSSKCKNEAGYTLQSSFNRVQQALTNIDSPDYPIWVTELNCYTGATTENDNHGYFANKQVMDEPLTAACLASMLGSVVNQEQGPREVSVFKMVQNLATAGSRTRVTKNGLFYASVLKPPFDVTGSTKVAEAYRMLLRKLPQDRHNNAWGLDVLPANDQDRFRIFAVDDAMVRVFFMTVSIFSPLPTIVKTLVCIPQAYYLYATNEEWVEHNITIDVSRLPSINANANAVLSATAAWSDGRSAHGEVVDYRPLGAALTYSLIMPPGSFFMMTAPKVPTRNVVVIGNDAVSVRAGANSDTNYDQQDVVVSTSSTDADDTAVALFRFKTKDYISDADFGNIVSAVLSLHMTRTDNMTTPQLLTVLAFDQDWSGSMATWNSMTFLKSFNKGMNDTSDNFIQWNSDSYNPSIAGMLTVQPNASDTLLRLDVTDLVKAGAQSFALVRLMRYDATTAGPADSMEGSYVFDNMGASQDQLKPQILVDVKSNIRSALEY